MLKLGWAFRYVRLRNGRRQILDFLAPGDLFDLDALAVGGGPAIFSTQSLTPVETCAIALNDALKLKHTDPQFRSTVQVRLRRHLERKGTILGDLGKRTAAGRLANLFLELHNRLLERGVAIDGQFELPITQEHLADAVGLTSAHVSRVLISFREAGIMRLDRRILEICRLDRMREIACEQ